MGGSLGELGAHLLRLWGAKPGVDGEGALPVMAGATGVTDGVVSAREAVVSSGLLVLIAGLAGEAERGDVPGAGGAGLISGEEQVTEDDKRASLGWPGAGLAGEGQGRVEVSGGFGVAGLPQVGTAEIGQNVRFDDSVTRFAGEGQGLLKIRDGCGTAALPEAGGPEGHQGVGFTGPFTGFAG
jgi:hypothetical protein